MNLVNAIAIHKQLTVYNK